MLNFKATESEHPRRKAPHAENYLYIFSRNHIMCFLRKKVLQTENIEFLVEHFQESTANPQERMEYAELRALMRRAINSLPDKSKPYYAGSTSPKKKSNWTCSYLVMYKS